MSEWQAIESAPREYGFVCMVKETESPFREVKAKRMKNGGWANMQSGILLPLRPSHWMPMKDDE